MQNQVFLSLKCIRETGKRISRLSAARRFSSHAACHRTQEGTLRLAWFDRRVPSEEKILLTRLGSNGDWIRLAETRSEVSTRNESLGLTQIMVPKGDTWVLLTGCVTTRGTSSLVVRTFDGKALSEPKMLRLE